MEGNYLKGQALCEQHEDLEGVYVADREADIMELYQARTCERMHFVQRSKHNRKLAERHRLFKWLIVIEPMLIKLPIGAQYYVKAVK